jgi:hypothetical protein
MKSLTTRNIQIEKQVRRIQAKAATANTWRKLKPGPAKAKRMKKKGSATR